MRALNRSARVLSITRDPTLSLRSSLRSNLRGATCSLFGYRGLNSAAPSIARRPVVTSIGKTSRRTRLCCSALFEKFTERSIKGVMIAQNEAKGAGATEVNTEHLLLGLIEEDVLSKPGQGYLNSGLTSEKAKSAIEELTGKKRPPMSGDAIVFSRGVRRTFEAATNECKRSNVTYISPEHILLALLSMPDSVAVQVMERVGVDVTQLKNEAVKRLKGEVEAENPSKKKKAANEGPKMLEEYCKDLCAEVKAGKIDPVIGRSREVARVTQILARRSKNNPILLGEPGVGKTAIAEGLAHAIVSRSNPDGTPLPSFLHEKRVMQLDISLIIAGAKERGELESRMTKLIAETKEAGDVILMIDEIHTLVGAGSAGGKGGSGGGGGLDIANLVKPALARGEFQVIGATTVDEFRKYIERDAALERRFQPVFVNEPTEEEAVQILSGLQDRYERYHKCIYTEEAIAAAVKLSSKYIADRFLPDKAIDLMDEAGSRARITAFQVRRTEKKLENPKVREYLQVLDTKDEAVKDGLYEEAVILQRRQTDYRAELSGPADAGSSLPVVDAEDIENIVATWTGIPVERMGRDEKERLVQLPSVLKERVIGQDEAVDTLAAALMRARCGLKDADRPIASLLFVGPTGVGKTELTKVLAEQYFGSRDAMIRLDMSEYMERHTVSKLIGAPPGFVGYGEGGKLTEAVRRRPCCLILLDEVEKAHPDVFNIMLQILEDGRLTDSQGRVVSFKNALIVMTSNIGSRLIASSGSRGAFLRSAREQQVDSPEVSADAEAMSSPEAWTLEAHRQSAPRRVEDEEEEVAKSYGRGRLRELVLDEIKQFFRPELLNRLDEQVVFQKLGQAEVRTIAGLMVQETAARVKARGYHLQLSKRLVARIIREGFSDEYGARPLRQAVIRFVDDKLSDVLLEHDIPTGSTLAMDILPDTEEVTVTHFLESSVTVMGQVSGFNGEIKVVQNSQARNVANKVVMHRDQ